MFGSVVRIIIQLCVRVCSSTQAAKRSRGGHAEARSSNTAKQLKDFI